MCKVLHILLTKHQFSFQNLQNEESKDAEGAVLFEICKFNPPTLHSFEENGFCVFPRVRIILKQ